MKVPSSRFGPDSRRAHWPRVLMVIGIALLVALVAMFALLVARQRTPLLAIGQTERPQDAIALWNEQDYEGVVEVSTEQLVEFPLDPTALGLRGFSRFYLAMQAVNSDSREQALIASIRDLRRVLLTDVAELEPEVHYVLGKAYFHRGEYFYDAAVRHLERARALGWNRLDLLEYLALASRDLGRREDAVRYFREAIEQGDEPVHRIALADVLIADSSYREADVLLSRAIAQTSDSTLIQDALVSLGTSLRLQERWNAAMDTYRRLLEVNEASAEAHYGLGEVYLALGEQDQARFEWREAIRLDPNHIESLQRLQEY